MPAHFEIRTGDDCKNEGELASDGEHEWIALVGGNGETMWTTETYPAGHNNARRALEDIITAHDQAAHAWVEAVAREIGLGDTDDDLEDEEDHSEEEE